MKDYERNGDSAAVHSYFAEYLGEATGSASVHALIEWGNENPEEAEILLSEWPDETRLSFAGFLEYSADQSGQQLSFELPDE